MTTRRIVVDASIATAIVLREADGAGAVNALSRWSLAGVSLVVPSHFWLEVTNALLRGNRWPGESVLEAIHLLDTFGFDTVELDRATIVLSIDFSERHGLTSYDAAYLALAESIDAPVATFDAALRRASGHRAIRVVEQGLSELPAAYEHQVTWPSYRGASAYLSKLRAEVARPR